mmetsp:Transcript_16073/g.26848  ORF Transcript_16073/g.26848 Transcript_16073/m.26848 type:complete len:253 (+) Transcript_16073:59-817(+)
MIISNYTVPVMPRRLPLYLQMSFLSFILLDFLTQILHCLSIGNRLTRKKFETITTSSRLLKKLDHKHGTEKCRRLLPLHQCSRKPVETFVKTITGCSTTGLNVPLTIGWAESVQSKLISHLSSAHGIWKILLVGENKKDSIAQFVLVQHSVHLITGSINTIRVVRIDNKDQSLSVLVVVTPQRTDLILTTDIPNCERDVLVFNSFNVESNSRNRGNDFTKLQFVENGSLSGGIKTNHQDTHLLLSEHAFPYS